MALGPGWVIEVTRRIIPPTARVGPKSTYSSGPKTPSTGESR